MADRPVNPFPELLSLFYQGWLDRVEDKAENPRVNKKKESRGRQTSSAQSWGLSVKAAQRYLQPASAGSIPVASIRNQTLKAYHNECA
jgi:hypothetical protein